MVDTPSAPGKPLWRLAPLPPRRPGLSDVCIGTGICLQRSAIALFRAGVLPRRAALLLLIWATRLSWAGFDIWRRRRKQRQRLRAALALRHKPIAR